jgi:uncharacterized protein (DUF885 family)
VLLLCLPVTATASPPSEALQELARDFWAWRARTQPFSGDDIPRIERPTDWLPDWSPASIAEQRRDLPGFERRWKQIDASKWPVAQQVNHRLIGSALARVRWELEILQRWRHNPYFYVDQTLGSIFEPLLPPPPFDSARSQVIVRRLKVIPQTLEHARVNLDQPQAPFARMAVAALADVRVRLGTVQRELRPLLDPASASELPGVMEKAVAALEAYRDWLKQRLPQMPEKTAVGREAYVFFLRKVALLPFTPEELLAMGKQEWDRAASFEAYEQQRNQGLPQLPIFPDQKTQMEREKHDELAVRRFLEEKGILSVPSWVKHYRNLPLPPYLEPLSFLGVTADHTSPARLDEDGVSYIRPPSPNLGYFGLSTARDPRPILVHEGVPGHYFQLVLSWAHEDAIRRHFYDSGPNEGLGFYAEEMMLQAGYFDDSPRTREIIYNFMRLRALRVEVDVKLALGEFSIEQAAEYLKTAVPMDAETAHEEAAAFAAGPGQAITYQIGKLQILEFLAAARRSKGSDFRLRDFHDFLWKNGNVPITLQRWEYLGLDDAVKRLDRE